MQITGWTTEAIAAILIPYAFAELAEWAGDPSQWGDQDARNRYMAVMATGQGGVAMPRRIVASVAVSPDGGTWGYAAGDVLDRVAGKLQGTPWELPGTAKINQHRKCAAILSW